MPMFIGSQSFISLPSFMFVSAAVSQIRKLNQNKEEEENSEIDYFQFKKVIIKIPLSAGQTRAIPIYTVLPYRVILIGTLYHTVRYYCVYK